LIPGPFFDSLIFHIGHSLIPGSFPILRSSSVGSARGGLFSGSSPFCCL
jgi:hypothetical protein